MEVQLPIIMSPSLTSPSYKPRTLLGRSKEIKGPRISSIPHRQKLQKSLTEPAIRHARECIGLGISFDHNMIAHSSFLSKMPHFRSKPVPMIARRPAPAPPRISCIRSRARRQGEAAAEWCLQEIVPGLYVAFIDDEEELVPLRAACGVDFSHVIHISGSAGAPVETRTGRVGDAGGRCKGVGPPLMIQRLACVDSGRENGIPEITAMQLLAARDFVSNAMPYAQQVFARAEEMHCDAKVLIAVPRGRPIEAMSVVVYYLAYAAQKDIDTVIITVADEDAYPATWQGTLSRDGLDFLQRLAKQG